MDGLLAPDAHARKPVSSNRLLGSLKEAVSWPGAERNTMVTLALSLVAARADEEGSSYFQDLSDRNPADPTAQALAGFFQVRAGDDVAVAVAKLDKAATLEPGLPQYFRGLALSELLPDDGAQEIGLTTADTARADQVMADLELLLAARDQFPVLLLRAAHRSLQEHREQNDARDQAAVDKVAAPSLPTRLDQAKHERSERGREGDEARDVEAGAVRVTRLVDLRHRQRERDDADRDVD